MEVEHTPPELYEGVAEAPADLLTHGISDEFEHTAVDFSITEVESNSVINCWIM